MTHNLFSESHVKHPVMSRGLANSSALEHDNELAYFFV